MTNYPRHMTADLLQAVRDLPKVSPYLHVPAQSGSNAVLQRMKRGYTVEQYREMLAQIRETVPHAAVTSDFIVGFCGETEDDFQQTVDLVREARFKNSFHLQVQPAPGHQERRSCTPTTCRRRSSGGGTTSCWRCRTRSARKEPAVSAARWRSWSRGRASRAASTPQRSDDATDRPHGLRPDRGLRRPARLIGRIVPVEIVKTDAFTLFGQVQANARAIVSVVRCSAATAD